MKSFKQYLIKEGESFNSITPSTEKRVLEHIQMMFRSPGPAANLGFDIQLPRDENGDIKKVYDTDGIMAFSPGTRHGLDRWRYQIKTYTDSLLREYYIYHVEADRKIMNTIQYNPERLNWPRYSSAFTRSIKISPPDGPHETSPEEHLQSILDEF